MDVEKEIDKSQSNTMTCRVQGVCILCLVTIMVINYYFTIKTGFLL